MHQIGKLDPDPHQSEKQDPDPHQSDKVETLEGYFEALRVFGSSRSIFYQERSSSRTGDRRKRD